MCLGVCMHACMHAAVHCVHVRVRVRVQVQDCLCARAQACVCVCTHACTHTSVGSAMHAKQDRACEDSLRAVSVYTRHCAVLSLLTELVDSCTDSA